MIVRNFVGSLKSLISFFTGRQHLVSYKLLLTSKEWRVVITEHISPASLKREFDGNYVSAHATLHVLQWNTLAQGLSNPENNFIRVKNETIAFDTRKWRILEQILIRKPDLCALEEVDTYDCFLQYHLPKYGYTCFFTPKPKSPCLGFQHDSANFKGPDGILLCFKTDLFDEIQRYHYQKAECDTDQKPAFFSIFELKHKPSSANIIFVGTHLKAKKQFANIRSDQAQTIIQYLTEHYSTRAHIIISGDFNGEADEPFYDIIRKAGFSSAYRTVLNDKEPLFTTWKFRENEGIEQEQCRTIDYIFYKSEGLVPIAILKLPSKEDIGSNGLPSNEYPSDHLALEAIFNINL
ncbi:unnamed protein product [Rotaria sordida]|uniref:Nocturnin n=1 Tax=Rotaria sordida TaxID=392033 RepID=A0A818UYJ4_9BILA|nr:unnamed protein product [Rotaria sordida]CAF3734518.1 unnamed protein product [Rotaria sordida]